MPGYGFSGPTTESGWNRYRIAKAWATLMARLGYERYGAVGNDGGSMISPNRPASRRSTSPVCTSRRSTRSPAAIRPRWRT